jgi:UDP-GlcNAc:undecaprenyl-phosphate GlcNAc-1-phosphate transferase
MILTLAASDTGGDTSALQGLTEVIAPYMVVFFIAFFVSFCLTPLMRMLAVRNGVVDWPDAHRKNHLEPIAYLGGVAIFIGWMGGVCMSYFTQPHDVATDDTFVLFPISVILGAAAIVLTGLFDDIYSISPRVKVGGQLFAAAALAANDVGIQLVDNSLRVMGVTASPMVVLVLGTVVIAVFVIGGCNALNLLDGLDGLAAGVATIACIGFLVMAAMLALMPAVAEDAQRASVMHRGDAIRMVMCLAAIGALLGFLPYNFNPASIFMGDAGSLLVGYLCVATMLLFSDTGGRALLAVTACLIIFALPITDTSLAIFRRKMRGKPILSPDNEHIHHLLRRAGLSVKQSVLVLYGLAILFAVLGCSLIALELRWRYVLALFVILYSFVLVTAYKYGHRKVLLDQMAAEAAGDGDDEADSPQPASEHERPGPLDGPEAPAGP